MILFMPVDNLEQSHFRGLELTAVADWHIMSTCGVLGLSQACCCSVATKGLAERKERGFERARCLRPSPGHAIGAPSVYATELPVPDLAFRRLCSWSGVE